MLASDPQKMKKAKALSSPLLACAAMSHSRVSIPSAGAGFQSNSLAQLPSLSGRELSAILSERKPISHLRVIQQVIDADSLYGKLALHLHPGSRAQRVALFQIVPWWLRLHMHTLSTSCNRVGGWRVVTSKDRVRAAQIELTLDLVPNQDCAVVVQFERAFMWLDEYPPDPSREMFAVKIVIPTYEIRHIELPILNPYRASARPI